MIQKILFYKKGFFVENEALFFASFNKKGTQKFLLDYS